MLSVERVTAGYGDTVVLRNVTIHVPDGTVVAVIGPNGAGKTTLLRVASGLIRPLQGCVSNNGRDLTGLPAHEFVNAGIHHVPEGRGVFRSLTVRENLVAFSLPGQEGAAVDQAVDAFPKLGQLINRTAGTMSGGEQQMLALSRAYIRKPPVVLLDEVSMGLAPNLVDDIFQFLERLTQTGTSLVLVEQFVSKALGIADHVYVLVRGGTVFAGEPGELADTDVFTKYLGDQTVFSG